MYEVIEELQAAGADLSQVNTQLGFYHNLPLSRYLGSEYVAFANRSSVAQVVDQVAGSLAVRDD